MKVLLVRNAYRQDFGGAERLAANMADELQSLGYETAVVTAQPKLLAYTRSLGVRAIKGWWWSKQTWIGLRTPFFPAFVVWQIILYYWYKSLLKRERPDVLHLFSRDDFIAGSLAASSLGIKVLWTDTADLKHVLVNLRLWYRNPVSKLVYWASQKAQVISLVSNSEKAAIESVTGMTLPDRFKVIHIAGRDEAAKPKVRSKADKQSVVFCVTARLIRTKGIGELVAAFQIIDKPGTNYRLWLIGEGADENELQTLADNNPHIIFFGHSNSPLEYVAASDIYVLPSYTEGLSLSLMEAAMLGKPIITTDVGGNPEIVNKDNGLLVDVKDIAGLAKAMAGLGTDAQLRQRLGRQARRDYETKFDFLTIIKSKFVPLYESPSKLKILFDAGPLVNGQKSGVGYYTEGLITNLASNYGDQLQLVGHYYDFLGRKDSSKLPAAKNIRYRRSILYPGAVVSQLRRLGIWIPFELVVKERGDFHLFPGFMGNPSLFKTPSAVAIHDLTYLEFPELVTSKYGFQQYLKRLVPRVIKRSAFVITISESTKRQLVKYYKLPPSKVVVGHIPVVGEATKVADPSKQLRSLGIKKPFILFLGNIEPRKNLINLVRAYKLLPDKLRLNHTLVLAGGKGWNDQPIINEITAAQAEGFDIKLTGYVTDDQRAALLTNTSLFVMPSINEGFGMPVLEAMQAKVPVAVSDIPVFHEVAGQAVCYFDQTQPAAIAKVLEKLLTDTALSKSLVEAGTNNLKRFSWAKTTDTILKAIRASVADKTD